MMCNFFINVPKECNLGHVLLFFGWLLGINLKGSLDLLLYSNINSPGQHDSVVRALACPEGPGPVSLLPDPPPPFRSMWEATN